MSSPSPYINSNSTPKMVQMLRTNEKKSALFKRHSTSMIIRSATRAPKLTRAKLIFGFGTVPKNARRYKPKPTFPDATLSFQRIVQELSIASLMATQSAHSSEVAVGAVPKAEFEAVFAQVISGNMKFLKSSAVHMRRSTIQREDFRFLHLMMKRSHP
ncbi:hypothetical protein GQ44DRAFT_420147 [Phaeosphaeriaceae sp. PMI808]|nr:hypothetical protein GQ44DRAFT_420147 [Phaeosphaeriaceae sp. PMI808]